MPERMVVCVASMPVKSLVQSLLATIPASLQTSGVYMCSPSVDWSARLDFATFGFPATSSLNVVRLDFPYHKGSSTAEGFSTLLLRSGGLTAAAWRGEFDISSLS